MDIFSFNKQKRDNNLVVGTNVQISDLSNLYGCDIGDETKIAPFVEVQKNVTIGSRCKISSHSFICEGVLIEDEVFIGHGVMFTNDPYPRAVNDDGSLQGDNDWRCIPTTVQRGASIGSGATILCGLTIGMNSIVGAGSVVTHDIPPHSIVAGNPARVIRMLDEQTSFADRDSSECYVGTSRSTCHKEVIREEAMV